MLKMKKIAPIPMPKPDATIAQSMGCMSGSSCGETRDIFWKVSVGKMREGDNSNLCGLIYESFIDVFTNNLCVMIECDE